MVRLSQFFRAAVRVAWLRLLTQRRDSIQFNNVLLIGSKNARLPTEP